MDIDILQAAALAYEKLTKVEYLIVLGRKGKTTELHISFQPENFYHLAGLHKLKMRYKFQQRTSAWILDNIAKGKIPSTQIKHDENYSKILPRLSALQHLSTIIEDNDTKFYKYDPQKIFFATKIAADYLAKGIYGDDIITFSFFVKESEKLYINSIFPMEAYDYSLRQTQYTVLLKEKIEHRHDTTKKQELYRHKKYTT